MDAPAWFRQLKWSAPVHVAALRQDRRQIPDFTGCYAFTEGLIALTPGRVLYVGEAAAQSLRLRLGVYLVALERWTGNGMSRRHKGQGFVLEARANLADAGVYVRWVEYGASPCDIHILEASLIHFLNPSANDRIEEHRHPLLGDDERLDRRLVR